MGFSSSESKTPEIPKGYRAAGSNMTSGRTGHPGSTGERDEVAVSVHVGDTVPDDDSLNEYQGREAANACRSNQRHGRATGAER